MRVSTHPDRGLGHIKRCSVLANALGNCVIYADPGPLPPFLELEQMSIVQEESRTRMDALEADAASGAIEAILVDSYDIEITPTDAFLVVVDDFGQCSPHANVVISSSPSIAAHEILDNGSSQVLAGPQFAMIDPAFEKQQKQENCDEPEILIFMGARDSKNATGMVLDLIRNSTGKASLTVLMGDNARHKDQIIAKCEEIGARCLVGLSPQDMADLYHRSEIVIGAGGLSLLERLAVGTSNLVVALSQNQHAQVQYLKDKEAIAYAGSICDHDMPKCLLTQFEALLSDRRSREHLVQSGNRVVDGKGPARVVRSLLTAYRGWESRQQ